MASKSDAGTASDRQSDYDYFANAGLFSEGDPAGLLRVQLPKKLSAINMMMCSLSQESVFDLDKRDRVPLVRGLCQNPFTKSDGSQISFISN